MESFLGYKWSDESGILRLTEGKSKDEAVSVRNVGFGYGKGKDYTPVLKDISYTFNRSNIYMLTGRSGSGKSTFLRLLTGIIKPVEGAVTNNLLNETGYTDQFSEKGFFAPDVMTEVIESLEGIVTDNRDKERLAMDELSSWGITKELWKKDPYRLSSGEKRKLALACVFVRKPELFLLDEPFAGLDNNGIHMLCDRIKSEADKGNAVIFTMH